MTKYFSHDGQEYISEECFNCGVQHAFPKVLYIAARNERGTLGKQIFCPNGHPWHYAGETEEEKQRRRAERAEQEQARLAEELDAANRAIARQKKRAAAGTCPCCNRTFTNMGRHMKTKHPDFAGAKVVPIKKKGVA